MIETQPQSPESSHPLVTKESTTSSFSSFMVPKVTYVVLILLLTLTVSAAAFMFLQNQSLKSQIGSSKTCDYNGQTYQVGEGFSASDACNSCSCSESGEVTCTEMACNISNPPESPNTEPVALTPDQSGKFTLNSTRLGFSTSFNAPDMLVTNCQGSGEGYEFWIYSPETNTRAGVCSYEGPAGILLTRVEDTSQIECWPNDETYSLERQEKVINQNNLIYCRSSLKNVNTSSEDYPLNPLITSAYIINPADNSAIWVWMQDSELQPVFDQILSTFQFTENQINENLAITFQGTLASIERPEPDIEYDYQLKLNSPYFDELNAQGPTNIASIVVVPENETIRQILASNIGNSVSIEGIIEWGLAETRHLKATKIVVMPDN